jgi:Bacterial SH3 domain
MASKLSSDALDRIVKSTPPGVWIWKLPAIDPAYLARLSQAGCRRVYLKVFDDVGDSHLLPQAHDVASFIEHGISVVGWGYHFDQREVIDAAAEAASIKEAMALGLEGYIADLEKEVGFSRVYPAVRELLARLRDSVGDKFLGYSSFGMPCFHPEMPWRIFDDNTDIAFPQVYFESWRRASWGKNDADRIDLALKSHQDLNLRNPILPVWGSEEDVAVPATVEDLQPLLKKFPGSSVFRIPAVGEHEVGWSLNYNPPAPEPAHEVAALETVTATVVTTNTVATAVVTASIVQPTIVVAGGSPPSSLLGPSTMEQMTVIAMRVSGQFEGDDPWANITGNFDDEGLTCGMLGKTFAEGDQQQTVHRFLESFGESELLKLMPRTGADYLRICALPKDQGTQLISRWSVKGTSANVLEPYLSELRAFWKSPPMISIQFKAALENEGKFAFENAAAWGLSDSLNAFCFFFDVATQGGSLKGLGPENVQAFYKEHGGSAGACQVACAASESAEAFHSNAADAHRNGKLWGTLLEASDEVSRHLFTLGWLRSQLARARFIFTSMNRRGTLALHQGFVNDSAWDFRDEFGSTGLADPPVAIPIFDLGSATSSASPDPELAAPSSTTTASSIRTAPGPMDGRTMKVAASSLNLRTSPSNANSSNIAVSLPSGQLVQVLDSSRADGWWRVSANFRNSPIEGFVASRYLADAVTETAPPASAIVAVNLSASAKLSQPADAHSLDEPGAPRRVSDTPAARCGELAQIIAFLAVERSRRYTPTSSTTFCNIYAYDYCCLAGVYLPRVWWLDSAIQKLSQHQVVVPDMGRTVDEMRANDIETWFGQYGPTFGWKHTLDPADLQVAANQGGVGIIVARNKADSHSGHIVVVPPETNDHKANRSGSGQVIVPLQSQAGRANFRYGMGRKGTPWWTTGEYSAFGLWSHA